MSRGTTIKEALKLWEDENGVPATEAKYIGLQFQWPPIEKMDSTLSTLTMCEKLSLSSNMIEKISGLSGMKSLTILSLARNNIKTLNGIETVGETLEELWLSYNFIERLKGIESLKKVRVLYLGNNAIRDWTEFNKLLHVPTVEDLLLIGNPLADSMDEQVYRSEVIKKLVFIKKLDGVPIVRDV